MGKAVFGAMSCLALAGMAAGTPAFAQDQDAPSDPFQAYEAGRIVDALNGAERGIAQDPESAVWWALAAESRAKLGHHQGAAIAFSRAAQFETDPDRRAYFRRAEAQQWVLAGQQRKARDVVASAIEDTSSKSPGETVDLAMSAIAAGDDATAQELLNDDEAAISGMTRQSALDAAYSAKRVGDDARAVRFFEAGLALDAQEHTPLDPVQREAIRRETRELSRDWNFLAQGTYSSAGRPIGPVSTGIGEDRAAQVGMELSRRIGGWRNGRPFSIFGRVYHTEFLSDDASTSNASQAWVGVRYKPLSRVNLNLEASRLIGLDEQGLDDWTLRAAISGGEGLEPQVGEESWFYAHIYSDLSYLTDADVFYGLTEGRLGGTFALDSSSTTLTAYAVARLDIDTGRLTEEAFGVGAGLSLRHWFDATDTVAHRGFIDFDVQARERFFGDRRATGVLASVTIGH